MIGLEINKNECNYCKECIDVCEENALTDTEGIFLDINKCTFCEECMETCPTSAINIYNNEVFLCEKL